jgi:AbrB family looped-hinge helix DNA binding protein
MATATLTSKGQITIPKEVRDALGVGTGDRVEFLPDVDGGFRILPATRDVQTLKGLVPPPPRSVSVEDMLRAVRRRGGRR